MTDQSGRLAGRRIALGITGSIAAYKAVELLRMLQAEGADVRVLMTAAATAFIGPLTLETLSRHPVDIDVLALQDDGRIGHISAANDVEAIVVAPATAHWLAAMAHGLAGDSITAACLATSVPVVVAPAMDGGMYAHPATQANVARVREFGYRIVEPETGPLASGMVGRGRLAELPKIVDATVDALRGAPKAALAAVPAFEPAPPAAAPPRAPGCARPGPRCPRRFRGSPRGRHRRRHRRADRPGPLRRQSVDGQDGDSHRRGCPRSRRGRDADPGPRLRRPARRGPHCPCRDRRRDAGRTSRADAARGPRLRRPGHGRGRRRLPAEDRIGQEAQPGGEPEARARLHPGPARRGSRTSENRQPGLGGAAPDPRRLRGRDRARPSGPPRRSAPRAWTCSSPTT